MMKMIFETLVEGDNSDDKDYGCDHHGGDDDDDEEEEEEEEVERGNAFVVDNHNDGEKKDVDDDYDYDYDGSNIGVVEELLYHHVPVPMWEKEEEEEEILPMSYQQTQKVEPWDSNKDNKD